MNLHDILKPALVPLHREGYRFFVPLAIASLVFFIIYTPLGVIGAMLSAYCYYFFRNPERVVPKRDDIMVAPADGVISSVVREKPPAELGLEDGKAYWRISVFMSILDCHVNRSPVSGAVEEVVYKSGSFLNASLDKASKKNERNSLRIKTEWGHSIGLVQIAGLVARRIVCYASEGERVRMGKAYGIIRFGSRMDVYFPDGMYEIWVQEGQKSVGGETVLAVYTGDETSKKKTR